MTNISPVQLHTLLKNGVITVEFTKVDGTNRVMKCTLNSAYLPEVTQGLGHIMSEADSARFVVWDVEIQDWRAFRVENVKSVKVNGYEYSPARTMLSE
jgi:hypothetical protein